MNKHFEALELNIVLDMLAAETSCRDAAEAAKSITPVFDMADAERLLSQTEDAFSLLARFGAPSFSGLRNVNNALHRAAAGGELNTYELLEIGATLRAVRSLSEWYGHCSGVRP